MHGHGALTSRSKIALTDFHHVDHVFHCPDQPGINPADALEEQLMYEAEDLIDAGIVSVTAEEYGLPYPWGPEDEEEATGIYPWGSDEKECAV